MKKILYILYFLLSITYFPIFGAEPFSQYEKIVFGSATEDLDSFEQFVKKAKEYGATHITVQAEDLPLAYWELRPKNDPYPAWVMTNPGLLKINPPEMLKPYIPENYGKKFMKILRQRCSILQKNDLQAHFHSFEPQMLPNEFFKEYPALRGPQVDNPLRSRNDRWSPSISHPDVLDLYSESIRMLKKQCPAIDILEFRTNDSGAGIGWCEEIGRAHV